MRDVEIRSEVERRGLGRAMVSVPSLARDDESTTSHTADWPVRLPHDPGKEGCNLNVGENSDSR